MFFTARERELALRRAALVERSAALRGEATAHAAFLGLPLALADRVAAAWRWLGGHPDVVAAAIVVFAVVRPARAFALARWSWRAWRRWRWLREVALRARAGFLRARQRRTTSPR